MGESTGIRFAAFTKPFMSLSAQELGEGLREIGFDAIELCVRDGYPVSPKEAPEKLPAFVQEMKEYGLEAVCAGAPLCEEVFAGCQAAGIPLIRTLVPLNTALPYAQALDQARRELEPAAHLAERYGVAVGIQHHYGPMLNNSTQLAAFLQDYPPEICAAVWDSAQSILAGEECEQALDQVYPRLGMVNLKNVYYRRSNGTEAEKAQYERWFTTGRQGMADWGRILRYLRGHGYQGPICLTHEYSGQSELKRLLREDLEYARQCLRD